MLAFWHFEHSFFLRTLAGLSSFVGPLQLRPYPDEQNPHKINVKPGSLGAIVRSYKSAVAYRLNKEHNATGIWQRNYYDRIIRNDRELDPTLPSPNTTGKY